MSLEPLLQAEPRDVSSTTFSNLSPSVAGYVDETQSYLLRLRICLAVLTLAELASTLALLPLSVPSPIPPYSISSSKFDLDALAMLGFAAGALAAIFPQSVSLTAYYLASMRLVLTLAKAIAFNYATASTETVMALSLGLVTSLAALAVTSLIATHAPALGEVLQWQDSAGRLGSLPESLAVNSGSSAKPSSAPKLELTTLQLLSILRPYFWPKGMVNKLRCFTTWALLGASKACNLAAPIFIGHAVQRLSDGAKADDIYPQVVLYSSLVLMAKILNEGQGFVYLGVKQVAFAEIAERSFEHLHSLSLEWHLKKKLGQTMRAMDRGIAAADTIMTYMFLYLGPSMVELCVIVVLFYKHFAIPSLSAIVFVHYCLYAFVTIKLTTWRKQFKDATNKHDNDFHDRATDSLVNYETVKYFTAERWEADRYVGAVRNYQHYSVAMQGSLALLNSLQQSIIQTCCCLSLCVAAYHVSVLDDLKVGAFVSIQVYTLNLFAPLSFLGTIYNAIIQAFVDMRNLSQLLAELPDIIDVPGCTELDLSLHGASVEFKDVVFHYPSQPPSNGLQGVSFKVEPGTETAFCGPTGAGKSTIFRLLFRFYDPLQVIFIRDCVAREENQLTPKVLYPQKPIVDSPSRPASQGQILVGGQTITRVSQQSLRRAIGVVPQDTVLFNDSILYNVSYGRRDASFEEVVEACKCAQIYDTIMKLPEQFATVVGERGLKLSGGEKQRVAIARCILKDAPILVLDEWSSALDTKTEKIVHAAIQSLSKSRTVLIIAHRLSTIRSCNQILVLNQGRIVEAGTHDNLVAKPDSQYFRMWSAQQDVEENGAA